MAYLHKNIKRWEQTGEVFDDRFISRTKTEWINLLIMQMRYAGYVPRFDIDPDWTVSYNGRSFDCRLSVFGIYIGRRKAECIQGLAGNRPIYFTPKGKSKEQSEPLASG